MTNNKPYENKRSELEQQASQYMINEFGEDWAFNNYFKQHENRFMELYNYDEVKVREIYKQKRALHSNDAPFLLTLSPILYNCILLKRNAFKVLENDLDAKKKQVDSLEDWQIYEKHAKEGNRFARQVIKSDPVRFGDKAEYLLELCKLPEPMTYKFKQAEMVGNIF